MLTATVFFMLLFGHALADYPLQGDFLAKAKNRAIPIPGVPWYQALGAHAIIHGGCVLLILHSLNVWAAIGCATAEVVAHALIDDAKCTGKFGYNAPLVDARGTRRAFNIDQALHIACKLLWAVIAVASS